MDNTRSEVAPALLYNVITTHLLSEYYIPSSLLRSWHKNPPFSSLNLLSREDRRRPHIQTVSDAIATTCRRGLHDEYALTIVKSANGIHLHIVGGGDFQSPELLTDFLTKLWRCLRGNVKSDISHVILQYGLRRLQLASAELDPRLVSVNEAMRASEEARTDSDSEDELHRDWQPLLDNLLSIKKIFGDDTQPPTTSDLHKFLRGLRSKWRIVKVLLEIKTVPEMVEVQNWLYDRFIQLTEAISDLVDISSSEAFRREWTQSLTINVVPMVASTNRDDPPLDYAYWFGILDQHVRPIIPPLRLERLLASSDNSSEHKQDMINLYAPGGVMAQRQESVLRNLIQTALAAYDQRIRGARRKSLSQRGPAVHCECALLLHLHTTFNRKATFNRDTSFYHVAADSRAAELPELYIATSRRTCWACYAFVKVYRRFMTQTSHSICISDRFSQDSPLWAMPNLEGMRGFSRSDIDSQLLSMFFDDADDYVKTKASRM